MNHKKEIDDLFDEMCNVMESFIELHTDSYLDGWIPITLIKNNLDLNKDSYPQHSKTQGKSGWFFAVLARALEDQGRIQYRNDGKHSFCRISHNS